MAADIAVAIAQGQPFALGVGVVAVQVPEGGVGIDVADPAVQFDEQRVLVVEDVGPGAPAGRSLATCPGQAVGTFDITAVDVLERALDAVEVIEQVDQELAVADAGAVGDRRAQRVQRDQSASDGLGDQADRILDPEPFGDIDDGILGPDPGEQSPTAREASDLVRRIATAESDRGRRSSGTQTTIRSRGRSTP